MKRLIVLSALIPIFALAISINSFGQPSNNIELVSYVHAFWSGAKDVAYEDDMAYIATGSSGLYAVICSYGYYPYGITDFISSLGNIFAVDVSGNYVYMLGSSLFVVDVSDPYNMEIVAELDIPGSQEDIEIRDDFAYITGSTGLRIVDISDPLNPVEVGSLSIPIEEIDISGEFAYAGKDSILYVIDISDPEAPVKTDSCTILEDILDISVSGEYAYLSDGSNVHAVEISGLAGPQLVNTISVYPCYAIEAVGDIVYITETYYAWPQYYTTYLLTAFDFGNVLEPVTLDWEYLANTTNNIDYIDGILYLASNSHFHTVDVNNPANLMLRGSFVNCGSNDYFEIDGNYCYVLDRSYGIIIINISDINNPQQVGFISTINYSLSMYFSCICVEDDYLYLSNTNELWIFNVSSPSNPIEIGFYEGVATGESAMAIYDNYLFASNGYGPNVINILDISDPANAVIVGTIDQYADKLKVFGSYLFAKNGNELNIYRISVPENPVLLTTYSSGWLSDFYFDGIYLYTAESADGLKIIDFSDPANPVEVGCYGVISCMNVNVQNGYAYVNDSGFRVLNVTDPGNIFEVGYYNTNTNNIEVDGEYAFAGTGYYLLALDCAEALSVEKPDVTQSPSSFTLSPIHPNPFNEQAGISYRLSADGVVNLAVYDITGREVQTLVDGQMTSGEHSVVWDAEGLASGMYFVKLSQGDAVEVRKAVLLK